VHTFQTSREIAASPAAIFAAISDPERLARWWGPDGFTNTFEVFDFQPGGAWKFVMHGPDGTNYPNVSVFSTIVKDYRVVITHQSNPKFALTILLSASTQHPGGTLVGWTQVFEDADVAKAVAHIVEPANEQNLSRMAAEVEAA
jgi:uncharacterized protein YndB with AHSA1/START domain